MRYSGSSGGPTITAITGTTNRAQSGDGTGAGSPTASPVPVPTGASTNYSYWVSTRLSVSAGAAGSITNIKWYTDGSNTMGTGVSLNVATTSAYVQATGTPGTTGNQLTSANVGSAWDYAASAADNAFARTSASPLSVSGSIGTAIGPVGDFVVYQVAVVSTAGPGTTTAETLTLQYDET